MLGERFAVLALRSPRSILLQLDVTNLSNPPGERFSSSWRLTIAMGVQSSASSLRSPASHASLPHTQWRTLLYSFTRLIFFWISTSRSTAPEVRQCICVFVVRYSTSRASYPTRARSHTSSSPISTQHLDAFEADRR
jgi:hypothetical protein